MPVSVAGQESYALGWLGVGIRVKRHSAPLGVIAHTVEASFLAAVTKIRIR